MSVWHPDGVADYGPGVYTGSGAGFYRLGMGPHAGERQELYQHRVNNILIEVRGDRAVSETYFVAHIRGRDEQGNLFLGNHYGRYADEWSRRDEVWTIDKRTQIFDFLPLASGRPFFLRQRRSGEAADGVEAGIGAIAPAS